MTPPQDHLPRRISKLLTTKRASLLTASQQGETAAALRLRQQMAAATYGPETWGRKTHKNQFVSRSVYLRASHCSDMPLRANAPMREKVFR